MSWDGLSPPYATIVADPPWPITWNGAVGGRRGHSTPLRYRTMRRDEIAALPVLSLAAPDCHLYLWVTPELNRCGEGVIVASAWGFTVVDEIVWEKPNLGMGAFPRHCHELLLVCRRGALPFGGPRDVRSVQRWAQRYSNGGGKSHSAKPAGAFDLIESVSPSPRVELFARAPRLGWDHWGYGYESERVS